MNYAPEIVVDTLLSPDEFLFRDHSYGDKKDMYYYCRLCKLRGLQKGRMVESHFKDHVHKANAGKLALDHKRAKGILTRSCRILSPSFLQVVDEAEAIPCRDWKDLVQAQLYRYVFDREDNGLLLNEAIDKLRNYRYRECLVVLALAVWKSECLQQMPNVNSDFFAAHQWITAGWKSCKHQDFNSGSSIIVPLVRAFLTVHDIP